MTHFVAEHIPIVSPCLFPWSNLEGNDSLKRRIVFVAIATLAFLGKAYYDAVLNPLLFIAVVIPVCAILRLDAHLVACLSRPDNFEAVRRCKTQLSPHLWAHHREDVWQFANAIIEHTPEWKQKALESGKPYFVKSMTHPGLQRSIGYDPAFEIPFVLLNRRRKGDSHLGEGSYKSVKIALNPFDGTLYGSQRIARFPDPNHQKCVESAEIDGFELVKGIDGCIQLVSLLHYVPIRTLTHSKNLSLRKTRMLTTFANGGDLEEWLIRYQCSPKIMCLITKSLLQTVAEIHRRGLIHRDLKAENVLIRHDKDTVKPFICDFGFLIHINALQHTARIHVCTPKFSPPEFAQEALSGFRTNVITQAFDLWGLGILLHRLWKGRYPSYFRCIRSNQAAYKMVYKHKAHFENHPEIHATSPQPHNRILYWLLREKPEDRKPACELLGMFEA